MRLGHQRSSSFAPLTPALSQREREGWVAACRARAGTVDWRAADASGRVLRAAGRDGTWHGLVRERLRTVRVRDAPGRRAARLAGPRSVHGGAAYGGVHVPAIRRHRQARGGAAPTCERERARGRDPCPGTAGAGPVALLRRVRVGALGGTMGLWPGTVRQRVRIVRRLARWLQRQLVVRNERLRPVVRRAARAAGDGGHTRAGAGLPEAPQPLNRTTYQSRRAGRRDSAAPSVPRAGATWRRGSGWTDLLAEPWRHGQSRRRGGGKRGGATRALADRR